jgi:glycosyltransferase involved in cell wall biosynthesis
MRKASSIYEVVHVAETIRGGIATYLREMLPLQRLRFGEQRVVVIAPEDQLEDLGEQSGVVLVPVASSDNRLVTAYNVRRALNRLLGSSQTKTVHIHSTFAGITCRMFSRMLKCRTIVYCPHGWSFIREGKAAFAAKVIERMLSRSCDAIVCVSEFEKTVALSAGLASGKLKVIRNALPAHSAKASSSRNLAHWYDDGLRLIYVGRFDRAKGFDVLAGALALLERKVEVHVFGASVLGDASNVEVPPNVHLHGWQPFEAIEPYIETCDALIMPSRWEAIGLAAIEAMRAGKAVLASRVGGLSEVVKEGDTGRLFPSGDCAALADIIEKIDQSDLRAMGARGRERFLAEFQIEQCEGHLADLYSAAGRA